MSNNLISIVTVGFVCLTVFFAIKYSNLLNLAKKEYFKAKEVVRVVVLTFKKRQDDQAKLIDRLALKLEVLHSDLERNINRIKDVEKEFQLLKNPEDAMSDKYKEVTNQITILRNHVQEVVENQRKINERIPFLEKSTQKSNKEGKNPLLAESLLFTRLTETERTILQLIIKEEAKTSSDVEKRIKKTREHTARLLKKLWQKGYIERDTHRVPYIYRIPENLKKAISNKVII